MITTYPNLYVALVGEAGSGKSVAKDEAKKIVEKVQGVKLAPDCSSGRAFLEALQKNEQKFKPGDKELTHCPLACFVDELSTFIGMDQDLMIPFLIKNYSDSRFEYVTAHQGEIVINGPAVSIVACCTEKWLKEKIRVDIIGDGLSARFLWILEKKGRKRNSWPDKTEEMQRISNELAETCEKMSKLTGEFIWTPEAREEWDEWYYSYYGKEEQNKEAETDEGMREYSSRKRVQIEKIAMLLVMADRLEITFRKGDFRKAVQVMDTSEKNLPDVFAGIGRNELSSVSYSAIEAIRSAGGIMHGINLRKNIWRHAGTRETEEILMHLLQTGEIIKVNRETGIHFRLPKEGENNGQITLRQEEALRET